MVDALSHPAYGLLRPVTPYASVLLVENPSPMTLDGTNTWVLRAPGSLHCVVVDPGPDDEEHLQRVAGHGPVDQVLLTHGHPDHAAGARRFAELVGAPVHAVDPGHRLGSEGLADGDVVAVAGLEIQVLATPGHTSDSLCFQVDGDAGAPAVLTGDTVLGRGSTVIAHPDGRLADYLASLRRLVELPPGMSVLPGHGPELPDAVGAARACLAHREERLEQVRMACAVLTSQRGREPEPREVVQIVYADVDLVLWPAADASVAAQLEYLHDPG
ncbi:MAG: MBL fold metallo-hydrolase [Actinobacteria bacterium]|nr:MBL fold metallo-hydrolase [Actinomycetota bacterium]